MMGKEVAGAIMTLALSFDDTIGQLYDQVSRIADETLRKKFEAAVGDLMGQVARDIIFPIEAIYPELRCDK